MGFFKKFFGGASFDDERKEADALFERSEFAEARLAYQRALDRKKEGSASAIEHCEERIGACLDGMAEHAIAEAARLIDDGHPDLAETELRNAMELASSKAIAKRARVELEKLEQKDAKERASLPAEMDDEDRWTLLAGNWDADQLDEYDEYGEPFRVALLALHDGRGAEARDALEAILETADEPCYLWLEVGRARLAAEDYEGAEEAFRELLDATEEGDATRLSAYAELANLRERAKDEEGAIAELEKAMTEFPDEPVAFLMMGRYLRAKDHADEAVEVLEAAVPLLDEDRPDWRYLEEVGLACAAAGEDEKAVAYFDRVIAYFVLVRRPNAEPELPPLTAMARSKLHEEAGELEKAADLYRSLARGPDRANHLLYHREAARLLALCDLLEEARSMLTRALALAEDQPEALAEIETKLAELE